MANLKQLIEKHYGQVIDLQITTLDEKKRGLAVLEELRELNQQYDINAYPNVGDKLMARLKNKVVLDFVKCIRAGKSFITQDVLLDTSFDLRDLDPACMFIIRAICGPTVFSDGVLRRVRSSWCTEDLPNALFDLLRISDNAEFKKRLFNYRFTWQEKTEAFAKSGLF